MIEFLLKKKKIGKRTKKIKIKTLRSYFSLIATPRGKIFFITKTLFSHKINKIIITKRKVKK